MYLNVDDKNVLNQHFAAMEEFSIVSKADVDWVITYVNDNFCKISWYSREELIWSNHSIVRHPDMSSSFFKKLWHTIKFKKESFVWIIKNKKKDWSHYWVKALIKPVLDDDSNLIEFISIRQDITKEVDHSEHMFKTIVENMSESVWIWDNDERTIYANPNFCNLLWYKLEEIVWEKSYKFWDEESARIVKLNNKLRKWGEKSKYQWNLLTKKWEKIPVFLSWAPVKWWWTVWIMTDLRELNSAKKLAEYQQAIESSSMLLKLNPKFEINYANKIFLKAANVDMDSIMWNSYFDYMVLDDSDKNEIINKTQNNDVRRWEIKLDVPDSDYLSWVFANIIPMFNKSWNLEEFLVLQNNITKEKNYEKKIQEDKNKLIHKLEDINKTKDEFLNIASHELRTPMTTIKWYISMILDWDLWPINDDVKLYLEKIFSSSNRLIHLINDMLDVQKLESWRIDFYYEEFDFNNLLSDLCADMSNLANEKNQNIVLNNPYKSLYINSDYNKLLQVMINLVWNAIKFTPEWGEVRLDVNCDDEFLYININDNWVWIAKEDLSKIFEKFWQVKNSLTRDISWTWLWLPIVKSIVESLWWKVSIESEYLKWTTVNLSIPTWNWVCKI